MTLRFINNNLIIIRFSLIICKQNTIAIKPKYLKSNIYKLYLFNCTETPVKSLKPATESPSSKRSTSKRCKQKKSYTCEDCGEIFSRKGILVKHQTKIHTISNAKKAGVVDKPTGILNFHNSISWHSNERDAIGCS